MSLDKLKSECAELDFYSSEYAAKQIHPIPDCPVVNRDDYILLSCYGNVVLDIGASGPLHDSILKVAKICYGIDREIDLDKGVVGINLDWIGIDLPLFPNVNVIVCGEVIEHLGNPLYFLQRLKRTYPNVPVIISVPNAFSQVAYDWVIKKSKENVNLDHVAWYSWRTLTTLLDRADYKITDRAWYKGAPKTAEGLIAVVI